MVAEVAETLRSRWIASGPQVAAFEAALGAYVGGRPVRTLTSATGAMEVALELIGAGPGDEVVPPALCFLAWCPIGAPIYQGTLANKPTADGSGRFYYETDTNRFWIDVADPNPAWVELGVVLAPIIDHGALVGLSDDDHPFYARVTDFETTTAIMSGRWEDLTDGDSTALHKHDHGAMDGLTDDDHTGYVLATGARAITGTQAFSVTNAVPFTVSNSTVVTNLNADYLDGSHATAFATASHTHAYSDHGALTGLADDDHTQYTLRSQWDQNGFPNSSQVALLWTDTTRTLLVSATGTTFFTYFQSGYPYTAASMSAAITDTGARSDRARLGCQHRPGGRDGV